MKKIKLALSIIITVLILASAAIFSVSADIKYIRGDADSNGTVNIKDVTVVQRVIAKSEPDKNGVVKRNCDVDNNGLSILDATNIQRYLAMYDNSYMIGRTFSYDEYELPFIHS